MLIQEFGFFLPNLFFFWMLLGSHPNILPINVKTLANNRNPSTTLAKTSKSRLIMASIQLNIPIQQSKKNLADSNQGMCQFWNSFILSHSHLSTFSHIQLSEMGQTCADCRKRLIPDFEAATYIKNTQSQLRFSQAYNTRITEFSASTSKIPID